MAPFPQLSERSRPSLRTAIIIIVAIFFGWGFGVIVSEMVKNLQRSAIQAEDPANWLTIHLTGIDAEVDTNPMVRAQFQVLRPAVIRLNISPRNKDTGDTICAGRITSTYGEPSGMQDIKIPISSLAGLDNCTWDAGNYVANITMSLTDLASGVEIGRPITQDVLFSVAR